MWAGGLLADGQIVVTRLYAALVGRVDYANAQAYTDQRIECFQFGCGKWEYLVITLDDRRGSRQGIGFVHHGVRGSDGGFTDRLRMYHIAIVYHAGDLPDTVVKIPDEHIVVVGIS